MRLLSLEIENWGPYRGLQNLNLDAATSAPVILIEGENERGKTSLFFALRYVLYGQMRDHDNVDIPASDLANWDARDEGDAFWFGAVLRFEHKGQEVELTRKCQGVLEARLEGPSVRILDTRTQMRVVGGDPYPEKDIDSRIQRILHSDISSFFLFDGETLTRVEKMLKSEDTGSVFVRDSLERALGIPALRLLSADVETLTEEAGVEVRKSAKAAKVSKDLAEKLDKADAEVTRAQEDLEKLDELRISARKLLDTTNAALREVDTIKEAYYERKGLRDQVSQFDADISNTETSIRQMLESSWWLPLASHLKREAELAADAVAEHAKKSEEMVVLTSDLNRVRKQIQDPTCRTCKQPMPSTSLQLLKEEEARLEGLVEGTSEGLSLEEVRLRDKRLRKYLSSEATLSQLQEFEADLKRLRLRRIDAKGKIETLTDVIQDNNLDIAALDAQANDAQTDLISIEMHIKQAQGRKTEALNARKNATADISKLTGVGGKASTAELEVLKQLDSYLDQAIGDFRNDMRQKIQDEASEIFRQLTTEPDYAGLRIDGNYYLSIVDANDRVVKRRSAGANQVVTMSLIGALAKCAVEEGPIVMDTPFARLDTGHRSRILKWTAALGTQVILFVQSGEFDRERDIKHLDGRVGRSYVLRRVGPSATKIEGGGDG